MDRLQYIQLVKRSNITPADAHTFSRPLASHTTRLMNVRAPDALNSLLLHANFVLPTAIPPHTTTLRVSNGTDSFHTYIINEHCCY